MTDIDYAALREKAESAREAIRLHGGIVPTAIYAFRDAADPRAVLDLLDEIERLRAERDEALAVIERAKARVADARLDGAGREDGTWNEALAYAARQLATTPADALREHDASLIEALADNLVREGVYDPDEGYLDAYEPSHVAWLREKARVRREGVS